MPGELTTVFQTLPAQTLTLPASTLTLPAQTTTIAGAVIRLPPLTFTAPPITTQLPAETRTIIQSVPGPGVTATATKSVVQDVQVCPVPVQTYFPTAPLPFNYTFGCPPGLTCAPPRPFNCDVFASPPPASFACAPSECIPAQPWEPTEWCEGETNFFPPVYGYFDLSPIAFGLSYDIFGKEVYEIGGELVTTGNWESQATITGIYTGPTDTPSPPHKRGRRLNTSPVDLDKLLKLGPRQISEVATVPADCYDVCNVCFREGQSTGKTDALCQENPESPFYRYLRNCRECAAKGGPLSQITQREYVEPIFLDFTNFCDVTRAIRAAEPDDEPLSQVVGTATPQGSLSTQSQAPPRTDTSQAPTRVAQTSEVVVTSTPPPTTGEFATSPLVASTSSPGRSTVVATPTFSSISQSVIVETSAAPTASPRSTSASTASSASSGGSSSQSPPTTTSQESTLSTELNAPIGGTGTTTSALPSFTGAANKIAGSSLGLLVALVGAFMALA